MRGVIFYAYLMCLNKAFALIDGPPDQSFNDVCGVLTELSDVAILQTFNMFDGRYIDWPRNRVPVDEPFCGYRGDKCVPVPSK